MLASSHWHWRAVILILWLYGRIVVKIDHTNLFIERPNLGIAWIFGLAVSMTLCQYCGSTKRHHPTATGTATLTDPVLPRFLNEFRSTATLRGPKWTHGHWTIQQNIGIHNIGIHYSRPKESIANSLNSRLKYWITYTVNQEVNIAFVLSCISW